MPRTYVDYAQEFITGEIILTRASARARNGERAGHIIFIFPFFIFLFSFHIAIDVRAFLFTTAIRSWSVKAPAI